VNLSQTAAMLVTLTALFAYCNSRYIKLPSTVGVMLISLLLSLCLIGLGSLGLGITARAQALHRNLDFSEALMQGMLSFLLFAGALHVDAEELFRQKFIIGVLATLGVLISTLLIGTGMYYALSALGLGASYLSCLLFGALISPTDPIAVMGFLKIADAPPKLHVQIAGESLFNDGVGVVLFTVLHELNVGGRGVSLGGACRLFIVEAFGGVGFGLMLGWIVYRLLKSIDDYQTEILLTLALVTGGYSLAAALHLSGPIAVVVAGLMIGNRGRALAMSPEARERLDDFWELIDGMLNAVLFVMIGLEVLSITLAGRYLLAGLIAIPLTLLARCMSVVIPVALLREPKSFGPGAVKILVWGGLRGGLSVAMALSLPPGREKELFVTVTYAIVVFSVFVQGLTIKRLIASEMGTA
jgi:CPA1 family monovalent cation:H+ antiporter